MLVGLNLRGNTKVGNGRKKGGRSLIGTSYRGKLIFKKEKEFGVNKPKKRLGFWVTSYHNLKQWEVHHENKVYVV